MLPHKKNLALVPALLLALNAGSAHAEPYRPLPRLAADEKKQRADETARLKQAASPSGTQAPAIDPAGAGATDPVVVEEAEAIETETANPTETPTLTPAPTAPRTARTAVAELPPGDGKSNGSITRVGDVNVVAIPPSAAAPARAKANVRMIPVELEEPPPEAVAAAPPAPEPVAIGDDPELLAAEAARLAAESARLSRLAKLGRAPGAVLALSHDGLGHTIQRTLDPTGRVIERTVDARGSLIDAMVVGHCAELPLVGELRDEAGTTRRVVRDASGALIDMVHDRSGRLVGVKVLETGQAM